jgi:hypothetical protein
MVRGATWTSFGLDGVPVLALAIAGDGSRLFAAAPRPFRTDLP